jgi:hypothetical protein
LTSLSCPAPPRLVILFFFPPPLDDFGYHIRCGSFFNLSTLKQVYRVAEIVPSCLQSLRNKICEGCFRYALCARNFRNYC